MPTTWVNEGDPDWEPMWAALYAAHGRGDGTDTPGHEDTGERWQYMGPTIDGTGHSFRHRDYPGRGRVYADVVLP